MVQGKQDEKTKERWMMRRLGDEEPMPKWMLRRMEKRMIEQDTGVRKEGSE